MAAYPLMNNLSGYDVSTGLQVPLQYVNDITNGLFMAMFIGLLWIGIAMTSYSAQVRRKGDANFFATLAVVGMGVFLFMLLLSAIPNLMNTMYLAIVVLLEIIAIFIWFVTERNY